MADGGEGTMDVLLAALDGERRSATVSDPLGRPVSAEFALLADGRTRAGGDGAGERARRSWPRHERDAWRASTRGTGELIAAAAAAGAERVVVTVGGSATTDGGAGALEALDEAGVDVDLEVVCDVRTPFEAAPRVFAPQKGADAATVEAAGAPAGQAGRRLAARTRPASR